MDYDHNQTFCLKNYNRYCKHRKQNYLRSINESIIPNGLKLKKTTAFEHVSAEFQIKWDTMLFHEEMNLV